MRLNYWNYFYWDQILFLTGYLIPKGWKVLPLFRNIHHNPENFPEPEKFDPSRFEVNIEAHKLFIHVKRYTPICFKIAFFFNIFTEKEYFVLICRLLWSPIHSSHLAVGSTHAQGMSLPSWRSWFYYIISPQNTGRLRLKQHQLLQFLLK